MTTIDTTYTGFSGTLQGFAKNADGTFSATPDSTGNFGVTPGLFGSSLTGIGSTSIADDTNEAWASDPAARGTALNTGLLVGFVRQLQRAGARRARFAWDDHVIQTPRLARRFAAREVGRVSFWTRQKL